MRLNIAPPLDTEEIIDPTDPQFDRLCEKYLPPQAMDMDRRLRVTLYGQVSRNGIVPRKTCWGCGVHLHEQNSSSGQTIGYAPSVQLQADGGLCSACFKQVEADVKNNVNYMRHVRHQVAERAKAVQPRTQWRTDFGEKAACFTAPGEVFFTRIKGPHHLPTLGAVAQAYCYQCPMFEECLNGAMTAELSDDAGSRHGIFAGLTPQDRSGMDREWYERLTADERQQIRSRLSGPTLVAFMRRMGEV